MIRNNSTRRRLEHPLHVAAYINVALVLAAPLSGCVSIEKNDPGPPGRAIYSVGKLSENLNATVPTVHAASRAALKELILPVKEDKSDALTGHLESEFSDGKRVWIDLEKKSDIITTLEIRVGMLGDEARAREILSKVKQHLAQNNPLPPGAS